MKASGMPLDVIRDFRDWRKRNFVGPFQQVMDLKNKNVLIYDHGDNTWLAERIARDVKATGYYSPWQKKVDYADLVEGTGLQGVERVEEFWSRVDEADLIYVPDVHDYDTVEFLRSAKRPVIGAGAGARLELDRELVREIATSVGLPVIMSVKVHGLTALVEYLKTVEDKWVKTNVYRGTMETFRHVNYDSSKPILDEIAVKLAWGADEIDFYVQDNIDGLEAGIETFILDGALLDPVLWGFTNGKCSIYQPLAYDDIPDAFRSVLDKIMPAIAQYGIRANFSTEMRYDGADCYLTDMTMRPPSAYIGGLYAEACENFTEVLFRLGAGSLPKPAFHPGFAGSAQLVSDNALKRWFGIEAPLDASTWLKLTGHCMFNGKYYLPPGNNSIGGIVATGESVEEVIVTIEDRYATLKSVGIDPIATPDSFAALISESEKYGVPFPS